MSLLTRVDVTAVKLIGNYVIAGVGSYTNIYDRGSSKLLDRIYCLRGQKIYGFVVTECQTKILVTGGKQFTVLTNTNNEVKTSQWKCSFEAVQCDDWLHSAIWLDNDNIAVLTAHNVVQKWYLVNQSLTSVQPSVDNPILYSGLLLRLNHEVLVLAGTVFSEVLIHRCGDNQAMHALRGHRGVIFSISCKPDKGLIVTTSDDRSVRIWTVNSESLKSCLDIEFWRNAVIVCSNEVYGHLARVMRSCITERYILSVGEDSALCFWSQHGKLLKKIVGHQNGSIWSVDADEENVITGGGDCGVSLHPITAAEYNGHEDIINVNNPKKVVFTARRNIVILSENSVLTYHDVQTNTQEHVKLNHESTYISLSISSCKQLIAVVDMCGNFDVFAERGKDTANIFRIINTKLNIGKILSMHWAGNRHIVFCSENGNITVLVSNGAGTDVYGEFVLPSCKERWLTAAAIDHIKNVAVLGDRCGNVHIYVKGKKDPIKSFNKAHGRYGPTSIIIKDIKVISTGRNGAIKFFSLDKNVSLEYMNSKDVDIQWVEKFLDKNECIVCGFQERDFIVLDVKNNSKIIEVPCGGGHRSWDAIRYIDKINGNYEEIIKFMYIKNSDLHTVEFELSKILSKNIIYGSHAKEINCLKSYQSKVDNNVTYFISGGEDTTLRVSAINPEQHFEDVIVYKQLSNIRALKTIPIEEKQLLVVSAGGRAQICIRTLEFYHLNNKTNIKTTNVSDYLIKGTDKERKGNRKWTENTVDFDPETRIMDIEIKRENDYYIIFAGCSDAYLRLYKLIIKKDNTEFKLIKELKIHKTCILKTSIIRYEHKDFLATCSTRGEVAFFDVSNQHKIEEITENPMFLTKSNKSGINSFSWFITSDKNVLIGTGGDDNSIYLKALKFSKKLDEIQVVKTWTIDKYHCSQITGLILLKNHLITTSIDQRVTLCEWQSYDVGIKVEFVSQKFSDVADIQGMELIEETDESARICVYGKGMEVLEIPKTEKK